MPAKRKTPSGNSYRLSAAHIQAVKELADKMGLSVSEMADKLLVWGLLRDSTGVDHFPTLAVQRFALSRVGLQPVNAAGDRET